MKENVLQHVAQIVIIINMFIVFKPKSMENKIIKLTNVLKKQLAMIMNLKSLMMNQYNVYKANHVQKTKITNIYYQILWNVKNHVNIHMFIPMINLQLYHVIKPVILSSIQHLKQEYVLNLQTVVMIHIHCNL